MAYGLARRTQSASVGVVWWAARNGKHAGASCSDLVLRRSGGGLGGGSSAGEDEDDDESADDMFHSEIPLKLYLLKKISLDNQMR
jgi:hypothetical protein